MEREQKDEKSCEYAESKWKTIVNISADRITKNVLDMLYDYILLTSFSS